MKWLRKETRMNDFSIQSLMDFLKNYQELQCFNQTSVNIKEISFFLSEKGITASKKIRMLEMIILGEQLSDSSLRKVHHNII